MDYEISLGELSEDFRRSVGVKIKRSLYNDRLRSAIQSLAPRVAINGFRKGKAPSQIIEKMYGEGLKGDILDKLWQEALERTISENSLEIVQVSNLHFHDSDPEKDLTIHADFTVRPRPELKNLDDLPVSYEVESYTDELLDEALMEIRRSKAKRSPITDRTKVEDEDLVNISYSEHVEGEEQPRLQQEQQFVEIGSGRSISDLEQGLVGQEIGEEREITVKYPEDYQESSVAGKSSVFKVKVNSLESIELPEITDEFLKEEIKEEGGVEKFKENLVKRLKVRIQERNQEAKMISLLKAVAEANPFNVPEVMIDEQVRMSLFQMKVLDPRKKEDHYRDVSGMRAYFGDSAKQEVVRAIILDQLVDQLKIEVSDTEIEAWVEKQAETYEATAEEIRQQFTSGQGNSERLRNIVARERAAEQIIGRSKVSEVEKVTTKGTKGSKVAKKSTAKTKKSKE